MTRKVAICGCGSSAEWLPQRGRFGLSRWEQWRLAWDRATGYADRWFEIHAERLWCNENPVAKDRDTYIEVLRSLKGIDSGAQLVLEADVKFPDYASAVQIAPYPMDKVRALAHVGDYFCSSIAYMMAMAFLEGVEIIGINVQGYPRGDWQEIVFERPNVAYLAGLFRAQGREIVWVGDDWHETKLLDEMKTIDLTSERMKRWHLEYLYGFGLGKGMIRPETTARRADLLTVPWKDPPRYGYQLLEETGVGPSDVLKSWAREAGVAL